MTRTEELNQAITQWLTQAEDQERAVTLGLTCGSPASFNNRAELYRRTAKSLEIERDTGGVTCACCLKPSGSHGQAPSQGAKPPRK